MSQNDFARKQKGKKPYKNISRPIAFISGRIGSAFVTSVVRGTEERVREFGENVYKLEHYPSAGRKNGAGDALREILAGAKAGGVIILSVMPDCDAIKMLIKSGIPAVFIERQVKGAHSVTIDNYAGGYSAGMQFVNNGRRRPGIILDPQSVDAGMASH
jgi:DNA-binding LacI/PurR family transcriptional regulator